MVKKATFCNPSRPYQIMPYGCIEERVRKKAESIKGSALV